MVAPIRGPITILRSNTIDAQGSFYDCRERWAQARPHTESLPYFRQKFHTSFAVINPPSYSGGLAQAGAYDGISVGPGRGPSYLSNVQARNSAVEKFRSRLSENAELLVTLAQRQQAIDMITNRGLQFLYLARLILKRDLRGLRRFARDSGIPTSVTRRSIRDTGRTWLEFSYGWVPFVQDIGSAVNLLQSPLPDVNLNVRGDSVTEKEDGQSPYNDEYHVSYWSYRISVRYNVGARLSIENPNLWLANRLGFTNPATVAWELVPFSFVVDWFVPVQAFLENFTVYQGLRMDAPFTTYVWKGTSTRHDEVKWPYKPKYRHIIREGFEMRRTTGLPSIVPLPRNLHRLSVWRAANAISLLVGFLKPRA